MTKFQGRLLAGLTLGALCGLPLSAHAQPPLSGQAPTPNPAWGQAPAPAYGQAPVAAPAYGQAPAPAPVPAEMAPPPPPPPPPVTAPSATVTSDNMSGQIGVGVGVVAGTEFIKPDTTVALRYWINDSLALAAQLKFSINKVEGSDTSWSFSPAAMILFSPLKVVSTRLLIGVGLGESNVKNPPADTTYGLTVPISLGVEHFFTKWFAMGIAMQNDLIKYDYNGSKSSFALSFDSTKYGGSLFFYTD